MVEENWTGFSGLQYINSMNNEILLDSGSMISLFKDWSILEDIRKANKSLLMDTNVGQKRITQQGNVPGFGEV